METNSFRNWCVQNRATMKYLGQDCIKCNSKLTYFEPSISFMHCGTDYWTQRGERRWKPKICMACRSKVGQHAKAEQDKQLRKAMYNVTKQAFLTSDIDSNTE